MLTKRTFSLLISSLLSISSASANNIELGSDVTSLQVIEAAQSIKRVAPKYPIDMAKKGNEGWVRLSFVIDEEGNVVDPIVHDSSGFKQFEREALKAVKQWKYSPAKADGKPIEQCNSKIQMDFVLDTEEKGVTRRFKSRYTKLNNALKQNDLDKSKELFEEFKELPLTNTYEMVYFSMISAIYYEKFEQEEELYNTLKSLVRLGKYELDQDTWFVMLQKLYVRQVQANHLANALDTFNLALETAPEHEVTKRLEKYDQQIKDLVSGATAISVKGKINERGLWPYKLLRNEFELMTQSGRLDRVDIRCDNKRSTYNNVKENRFIIPDSWGECLIYVEGKQDSEFSLTEYQKS